VRDPTAGAQLAFEDRGLHGLKGVPEPRQLFAIVRWGSADADADARLAGVGSQTPADSQAVAAEPMGLE
jgi:hypothetical protein